MGNLTDDEENYKYTYDVWGRLRAVRNQSDDLVAEYRYNGLGFRMAWHDDADEDGGVDGSDPWYFAVYDPSWRQVAVFRGADTNAKELFVPHATPRARGLDGVILRDRDANTDWEDATDGTREERIYYCQNLRGDVVKLISALGGGRQLEGVRYSAYGVPTGIATGDHNGDGVVEMSDLDYMIDVIWGVSAYDITCDLDLDGDVDFDDLALRSTAVTGRGVLSEEAIGNRRGYAGYEHDRAVPAMAHVRHRVYLTELGRWTRRDPLGYVDGPSLYAYARGNPVRLVDAMGLLGRDPNWVMTS